MRQRTLILSVLALWLAIGFWGCNPLNPSVMLKTHKKFVFDNIDSTSNADYRISPDDRITLRLLANKGFKLIDITSLNENQRAFGQTTVYYRVEADSTCNLPVIGFTKIAGLTIEECERFLEKKYAVIYKEPFAQVEVINRRVMVFPGQYGQATVITLRNENTSLMEGLAQAGGMAKFGKARNVKLIRGDINNPKVYEFDLSTIEGYKLADITLQANDIVYVEPVPNTLNETLKEVAPILSLLTSVLSLYLIITRL